MPPILPGASYARITRATQGLARLGGGTRTDRTLHTGCFLRETMRDGARRVLTRIRPTGLLINGFRVRVPGGSPEKNTPLARGVLRCTRLCLRGFFTSLSAGRPVLGPSRQTRAALLGQLIVQVSAVPCTRLSRQRAQQRSWRACNCRGVVSQMWRYDVLGTVGVHDRGHWCGTSGITPLTTVLTDGTAMTDASRFALTFIEWL
jgi:hypothetical protein